MCIALDEEEVGAWINGVKISDLRFADDIALLAESKDNLQKSVDKVAEVSTSMGMQMNVAKTETQFLGKGNQEFEIQLNGQKLVQSENFRYLGGIISTHEGSEADVKKAN